MCAKKGLVAVDGPMKEVTSLLMMDDGEMELTVVAIVGSGGLGKTILAMEVYRKIEGDFQCRACVSVSRTLCLQKLMKDILSRIDKDAYRECQSESWGIEQIIRKTAQILTGKRCFIVIDDVWKEQDWEFVKAAFPDDNNGSRIIATTRITGVANLCCSDSGGQPYQVAPLNDVDSRRLFFKRIFRSDDHCPAELEEVSTRILKKCGGVPLAIITFASLLANKTHKKDEWERLQDSIGVGSSLENDGNLKGMKDILLLSYWDLPYHLKTCLLYLCIYPEDYIMKCEELKWKWIAEGFLATQWGCLDQVAQNCFNELVNRNMIQPVDVEYDGSVKSCRVHDIVLDLIISLSDEENFATVLNGRVCNFFPSKIRRLSMQSSGDKEHKGAARAITENRLHVRSLTLFGPVKQALHLVDFHALRVLDLRLRECEWVENKHVKNIPSARQLRDLHIDSGKITELPGEIGNLQHLERLDLDGCYSLRRLASTVVQLQKLVVRLFVSCGTQLPAGEFGSMQALEALDLLDISGTDNPMRFAEELGKLTKLRLLSIDVREKSMGDYATTQRLLKLLVSSISELGKCNLRYLCIRGDTNHTMENSLFWDPSCSYTYLQALRIHITFQTVPKGIASAKNLVKLTIPVREFNEEGLHLLMGMPSLAYLQLGVSRQIREKLAVSSNGFKLLKLFDFQYTPNIPYELEPTDALQLTFAPGAVPALRWLRLEFTAIEVTPGFFSDLGVEHCSGLAHLVVNMVCCGATPARVEALDSSIKKANDLLPKFVKCE